MGIIIKQSIKSTSYSYLGAVIGAVNTGLLMPKLLSTEEIGLINYIIAISLILSQFSSLGLGSLINRIFPYFRDEKSNHNGFFTIGFVVSLVGSLLSIALYFIFKAWFLKGEHNTLEAENYIYYIVPLTIVYIYLNFFDNFLKGLYNSTIGILHKEITTRILITLSIVLYYFEYLDLTGFVLIYFLSYSIPVFLLSWSLIQQKEFVLRRPRRLHIRKLKGMMFKVSFFGIISGFSGIAILNIDKYMLEQYVGFSGVGVYAITFYFATMILMPARAIQKISTIVLSESWKNNDLENINVIYKKSSITQLIIGSYIFIGLWANIDNIIEVIGPDFESGRNVIFFIGMSNLIVMVSGVAQAIIATSKKFVYASVFMLIMLALIIVTNWLLIPVYGVEGAAFASFLSMGIVSLIRYLFIWKSFKLQPYNYQHLLVIAIVVISYVSTLILPSLSNPFIDIVLKGIVISIGFGIMIYFSKVSMDINEKIDQVVRRFIKI